ncbi:MAG: porphobilinogen synthase [Parasphingorhabdus sp.]|uniref:porphobilinogen synthase n=1 Tax=Parasphingorhabdus sp. TaxID=2709688 RepID=UPI003296D81D
MTQDPAFPRTRLRRTRVSTWSRAMVRENILTPADLIWPLFISDGDKVEEPIASLPGVSCWSVDLIVERAKEARDLGIPCVALFPNTPTDKRSDDGSEALNIDNLMCRATKAIKDALGDDIGVLTDVALDPYTTHGQDGLINADGYVENDRTLDMLTKQALNQANAGADIIAPSDMMDGRIGAIRDTLELAHHHNVQIMSYAAKYASAFYGPFRDAVGSSGTLKGDKKSYQMDAANSDEAMREIALDIAEGADSVMVKPGLAYLDIIYRAKSEFNVPVFAYQVSGEYALVAAGAAAGIGDRDALMMEKLIAFKRAGCSGILTYFAADAARLLNG